ncbi:DUF4446 family protein [Nocardiopsis valliformis]|uniref:DUF4446 family protein n=1 Tax=Nocardiopsis valliformis TaxID=239974 RepID=UPI00034BDA1E|nr:DUF4446 family protein [Nocardiopsis valliformis]
MFTTIMASIALLIGLGGLALGVYALYRTREVQGEYRALAQRALAVNSSGADPRAVRDVAVLHYDALEEMSGARSFSLAMLNAHGDGVVVTSINGRTETRTYAKAVTRGEADHLLSPEEYRVIRSARLGNGIGFGMPEPAAPEPARAATSDPAPDTDSEALVTVVQGPEGAEGEPDSASAEERVRAADGDRDSQPAEEPVSVDSGPRAPKPRPEN